MQKVRKPTIVKRVSSVDIQETMKLSRLFNLQHHMDGFEMVDLTTLAEPEWIHYTPSNFHWKNDFLYLKIFKEADMILLLPCLKAHRYNGHFTLSLKLTI